MDKIIVSWQEEWEAGQSIWHYDVTNPFLDEFFHLFEKDNLVDKRIFVPLCGKSVDLKFFYDKGMSVVGVDNVEVAVEAFFKENELSYHVEDSQLLSGCKVYRHDNRLAIFVCDMFKVNVALLEGPFDYLWDRAAFGSITGTHAEQQKYCNVIDAVLSDKAKGLVECFVYDRSLQIGPPYSFPMEKITIYYKNTFNVEELCCRKNDELPEWYRAKRPAFQQSKRAMYFIKRET